MAIAALASMAALGLASPAQAGNPEGKVQIKLMGSAVLPDGKISKVDTDLIGLPAGLQTEANDNYVPTIAIEYFFNPNLSVETICCTTQHDVDATTGVPGAELVSDALIVPATFTLKYHFGSGRTIKPYIGAGPAFFLILDDEPGATAVALGADDFKLDNAFGFALQAGVDVPLGDNGLALSLDAKKYFISSDAHWYAGGTEVIGTEHKLDPWVLSAGLGFRF
jgi:outer membrane protein